ncbi:MAG: LemA family protein [Clostridia bacterium]|nr:LemA family protein [Clostridia bacterium]
MIALIIVAIFFIIVLSMYNGLIRKRNAVKQSRSSIDVYLTQRFDLIPNLIETVKGYAKHEKEVFESITKLRSEYEQTKDLTKASELNKQIDNILLIGENYPELKSSENFLNLQKNLTKMEDQLQAARRLYNTDVTSYNTSLQVFPTNLVASAFHFKEEKLFELEAGKQQNIKVEL